MIPGVVLITGCSTGIGRATATTLAAADYRVVATARHPETLDGLGAAMALALDVTDDCSIATAVEAVLQRYGRIDALVNNAGYALRGAVEEVDVEAVGHMFDVNVLGIIRMARHVAPVMRRQGAGRIVNVGSLAGKLGGPANGTYAATKHAVEALSDAMRWELAPFGIQVVLVRPGAIHTSFEETVARNSGELLARKDSPYAPLYARVAAANANIRAAQPGPEAVADVILAALRAEHPHARYPAAVPFLARIATALPDPPKDLVVRRMYGLDTFERTATIRLDSEADGSAIPMLVPAQQPAKRASPPREVAAGVYWLPVRGANVYLVPSGGSWVLIDAAWANCGRRIRRAAAALFGADARPAAILLTHVHPDHVGSALELARLWGCPVYVPLDELALATAEDVATLERYANPLDRCLILPVLRALPRRRVEAMLAKGSLGGVTRAFDPDSTVPDLREWTCVRTPGHSPGHVAFFRERDRVLLTGDAILTIDRRSLWGLLPNRPSLALPPSFSNWDELRMRSSVATLAALKPRVVASGHGIPMVGDWVPSDLGALAARVAPPPALAESIPGALARRVPAGAKGAMP